MSDTNQMQQEWSEMVEEMNDAVVDSMEQNMKAQAAFVESWADAVEARMPREEELSEGFEGYNRAYEEWLDAAERMVERSSDAAHGEDVDPSEFRDIWLQSANEAMKHVMGTSAFAAANGQLVESMMEMQQEVDDMSQDAISQVGLPTRNDVEEVGQRLIELERRQHAVESQIEEVADRQQSLHATLEDRFDKLDEHQATVEETLDSLESQLDERQQSVDDKLDSLESQLDERQQSSDEQFDSLESQLDERQQSVDDKLDSLESRLDERQQSIDEKLDSLESQLGDQREE